MRHTMGGILKGISVLGTDIGGMNVAEARTAIEKAARGYPSDKIAMSGPGYAWTVTPSDLGVAVDVDKTISAAQGVGRSGGFFDNMGTQLGALFGGCESRPCNQVRLRSARCNCRAPGG